METNLNEICSDLIQKGMNENEVHAIAREQGIDFDEDLPDQFNRNNENNE